jgi:hypothetical protein
MRLMLLLNTRWTTVEVKRAAERAALALAKSPHGLILVDELYMCSEHDKSLHTDKC